MNGDLDVLTATDADEDADDGLGGGFVGHSEGDLDVLAAADTDKNADDGGEDDDLSDTVGWRRRCTRRNTG